MINNKSDSQQFWTAYSPGRRAWGRRINTLFSHLKTFLSRNLNVNNQNKLKNALYFLGKAVTVFSAQVLRHENASTAHFAVI